MPIEIVDYWHGHQRRFLMAVLIVAVLPTVLTLLDLMVLKQGGKVALGMVFFTPVTALVLLVVAVKAKSFVLFLTLSFVAVASVLVPLFLMLSRARVINLWSPVL